MEQQTHDVLIAGAGPIGIACAISAKRVGLDPLVIDAGALVNSIVHYPPQMVFFTTPELLEIGGHPFPCSGAKPRRDEALKYYRGVVRAEGIRTQTYTKLQNVTRDGDMLRADVAGPAGSETFRCRALVLATGYFDHPNLLDVPGEDLPHVFSRFDEGHRSFGRKVVVVGGKNSAIEATLELYRAGADVTMVYRHHEFRSTVKYWLRPDIENRIEAGEIRALFRTDVVRFEEQSIVVCTNGQNEQTLEADRVYKLIGYRPGQDLFRRIGITLDPRNGKPALDPETFETNVPGVYMAGSITAGNKVSEIFIENGRFDGEKIFGGWNERNGGKLS